MRICLLIRGLNVGGAQRQIITLANGLIQRKHEVFLITFSSEDTLGFLLDKKIVYLSLGKQTRWDLVNSYYRLLKFIQLHKIDIVYSFMEVANIASGVLKIIQPNLRVVWGIRRSYVDMKKADFASRTSDVIERCLSLYANRIIFNSYDGQRLEISRGYPARKTSVIQNGFDVNYFLPDAQAGAQKRKEWGIAPENHLIGVVGRLDPMKGHETFLRAAKYLADEDSFAKFVFIGDGTESYKMHLQSVCVSLELEERVLLVGNVKDMPAAYNAIDLLVSSSYEEGFPNVVGESMSCGVPCVVTDVGDSALIVDILGKVVPPRDPLALATAMKSILFHENKANHIEIRKYMVENFNVDRMIQKTEEVLEDALQDK